MKEAEVDTLAEIALKMLSVSASSWSGKIAFELNVSQGGFGDTYCDSREKLGRPKKRRVRSSL